MSQPLHSFIHEMQRLPENSQDSRISIIDPAWRACLRSLLELQECIEEMPILTEGRWFLRLNLNTSHELALQRLRKASADMKELARVDQGMSPPLGFVDFAREFLSLSQQAEQDLTVLHKPYQMRCRLQLPTVDPDPPQTHHIL